MRGSVIRFTYAILRAGAAGPDQVLCEGETVHMVVGRDMKRRSLPERYAEHFRLLLGSRWRFVVYAGGLVAVHEYGGGDGR